MRWIYFLIAFLAVSCLFGTLHAWGQTNSQEGSSGDKPAAESEIENATHQLGQTAGKALEAVKSGNFSTAAELGHSLMKSYAVPAMTALVVLIVAYFLAAFVSRICSAPIRKRVDETLGRFVGRVVFYLIIVSAFLGILQYFGIGVTSFAAVIGAASFAVGLAFQGTLSNFSAGVMLLVFRPFKVGDVITAAGITAKVNEIDLFATTFDTPDNRRIIVPNSKISGGIIENVSHHEVRRIDITVGVDYSADIDTTRTNLLAATQTLKGIIEGEGRGMQIYLSELADSSVNWVIRVWVPSPDYAALREELLRAIKLQLDDAGIGIPFPQMDVHIQNQ